MDYQFDNLPRRFSYKNQRNIIVATEQTRVTRRVNPEYRIMRIDFDRRLKLELHGSKVTFNAGLIACRERDQVLGLTDLGGAALLGRASGSFEKTGVHPQRVK